MSTYSFICATKKSKDFVPLWKNSIEKINHNNTCNIHIEYNNKDGLSKVYNKYFDTIDTDYAVCIHDDVNIDDVNFFNKVEHCCNVYNILGVAGGKSFSFRKYDRLSWMAVLNTSTDLVGAITHKIHDFHGIDYFSAIGYGNCPSRVLSIDGVIMIFSKKAYKTLRFDEQFTFDFYDLDLSFSAHKNNISVGVVPIAITHYSKGLGILQDSYLIPQKKFIEKWQA